MTGASADGVAEDWAGRFEVQSRAGFELGSELYGRLLGIIAEDIRSGGPSWQVISSATDLRFGQAGPLRLVGGAHRLALSRLDPQWASLMPSCGGEAPAEDSVLRREWLSLIERRGDELAAGLTREVQTNEVGRASGLGLALASTGFETCGLIELGCSGGLNLRLDRFGLNLGDVTLGDPESALQLAPQMRSDAGGGLDPSLRLPLVETRVGMDPNPIDATTEEGRWTLSSFVWPDQTERFERLTAALNIAAKWPAQLIRTDDTVGELDAALSAGGPRVVQHSIVWQYIPTDVRWAVTDTIESYGSRATESSPLAWIRYEPDEWNRSRAAIHLRTWPGGADRLVAHADYHGRWLAPVSAP